MFVMHVPVPPPPPTAGTLPIMFPNFCNVTIFIFLIFQSALGWKKKSPNRLIGPQILRWQKWREGPVFPCDWKRSEDVREPLPGLLSPVCMYFSGDQTSYQMIRKKARLPDDQKESSLNKAYTKTLSRYF